MDGIDDLNIGFIIVIEFYTHTHTHTSADKHACASIITWRLNMLDLYLVMMNAEMQMM